MNEMQFDEQGDPTDDLVRSVAIKYRQTPMMERLRNAASTLTSPRRPLSDPSSYLDPSQVPREGYGATAIKNLVGSAMEAAPDDEMEMSGGLKMGLPASAGSLSPITAEERTVLARLLHGHIPKMLSARSIDNLADMRSPGGRAAWEAINNSDRFSPLEGKRLGKGVHATAYELSPDKILKVPNHEVLTDDMLQRIAMDANLANHNIAPDFKWGVLKSPEISLATSGATTRVPFKIEERLMPHVSPDSADGMMLPENFMNLKRKARGVGALPGDIDYGHNIGHVMNGQPGGNNLRFFDSGHFMSDSNPIDLQKLLMERQLESFPPYGSPDGGLTIAPRKIESIQDFTDSMNHTIKRVLGSPVAREAFASRPNLGNIVPKK